MVVANWPRQRRAHWSALLRARAIENQAFVVGVNRVGTGDGLTYVGDSVILDPLGEPVATAGASVALFPYGYDNVGALALSIPLVLAGVREHELTLRSAAEVAEAIRCLAIRGAPLIGVAAGYGVALELALDPTKEGLERLAPTIEALAEIPEEDIWLAKQKSKRTRRAYKQDMAHFMRTLGIRSYEELRQVDHRAVYHPAPARGALQPDETPDSARAPREKPRCRG